MHGVIVVVWLWLPLWWWGAVEATGTSAEDVTIEAGETGTLRLQANDSCGNAVPFTTGTAVGLPIGSPLTKMSS